MPLEFEDEQIMSRFAGRSTSDSDLRNKSYSIEGLLLRTNVFKNIEQVRRFLILIFLLNICIAILLLYRGSPVNSLQSNIPKPSLNDLLQSQQIYQESDISQ
jgi:hypothetical protein